jgi:hypothetical protein
MVLSLVLRMRCDLRAKSAGDALIHPREIKERYDLRASLDVHRRIAHVVTTA